MRESYYCPRSGQSGKCLTEEREILNRWTEYCSELYNHKANGNPPVLNSPQTHSEDNHPIFFKEVEAAVQSLKKGKSAGVDNVPAELVEVGGEDVITTLTTICNKIWQTGEWPTLWTQSLVITLSKKGNLQQCQNYWMISLISHPSKVMLKITLNRLKPQTFGIAFFFKETPAVIVNPLKKFLVRWILQCCTFYYKGREMWHYGFMMLFVVTFWIGDVFSDTTYILVLEVFRLNLWFGLWVSVVRTVENWNKATLSVWLSYKCG